MVGQNSERPNGKAWKKKKEKIPPVVTPERQAKKEAHQAERNLRREARLARMENLQLADDELASLKFELLNVLRSQGVSEEDLLAEVRRLVPYCSDISRTEDGQPCLLRAGHRKGPDGTPCRSS